jgi:hypothetical protein
LPVIKDEAEVTTFEIAFCVAVTALLNRLPVLVVVATGETDVVEVALINSLIFAGTTGNTKTSEVTPMA